jgi:hypothetical protein
MDEPSRSPYWLDLDNGPVFIGIGPDPKTERDSAVSVSLSSGKSSRSHGERMLGIGPVAQVVRAHA